MKFVQALQTAPLNMDIVIGTSRIRYLHQLVNGDDCRCVEHMVNRLHLVGTDFAAAVKLRSREFPNLMMDE